MLNRIHNAPRAPYRPFVRADVFPTTLKPRGARVIGAERLEQLRLPEPSPVKVHQEWTYEPYEESA
jgi:hypothetical protein